MKRQLRKYKVSKKAVKTIKEALDEIDKETIPSLAGRRIAIFGPSCWKCKKSHKISCLKSRERIRDRLNKEENTAAIIFDKAISHKKPIKKTELLTIRKLKIDALIIFHDGSGPQGEFDYFRQFEDTRDKIILFANHKIYPFLGKEDKGIVPQDILEFKIKDRGLTFPYNPRNGKDMYSIIKNILEHYFM